MPKRVVLHIGTHKTGTKTLQLFLHANRLQLAASGVLIPESGRIRIDATHATPGQHGIALELQAGDTSEALDHLTAEISKSALPLVVVSSEEFHPLHRYPHRLALLRDRFAQIGYATTIVVSLRRQDTYAESLYVEYTKGNYAESVSRFVQTLVEEGSFAASETAPLMAVEYGKLLAPFLDVFGRENVIARPYHVTTDPQALPRAFLSSLATLRGGLSLTDLSNPSPFENPSIDFGQFIAHILHARGELTREVLIPDDLAAGHIALLTYDDALAISTRFLADNERVASAFACPIDLPAASALPRRDDPYWDRATRNRRFLDEHFGY
ncbi:MAG: hypothetical protein ACYDA1_06925 [Vulcanimicrobiaceae bacterium]